MKFNPWLCRLACASIIFTARSGIAAEYQSFPSNSSHHHYKFVDLGTLGGLNSYFSSEGVGARVLNSHGVVAAYGDTSRRDPYAPSCWDVDCHLAHAFRWQGGIRTDLGAFPGNYNSAVTEINEQGWIV